MDDGSGSVYLQPLVHPRDERIRLVEDKEDGRHVYYVDGKPQTNSVTRLIKAVYPEFDVEKTLDRMQQTGTYAKRYGDADRAAVKAMWSEKAAQASALGRKMHAAIHTALVCGEWPECRGLNDPNADIALELGMAASFVASRMTDRGNTIVRSEVPIFYEGPGFVIPGTPDGVFRTLEGRFGIYDWKRCAGLKMPEDASWCGVTDVPEFTEFAPNVTFYHYSLQLCIYAWILKSQYGLDIDPDELWIVVLHTGNPHNLFVAYKAANMMHLVEKELFGRMPVYLARLGLSSPT